MSLEVAYNKVLELKVRLDKIAAITSRVRRGWSDEKVLTTPFRESYNYFRNENPQE